MILVRLEGDLETEYTTHPIGVGGKLRIYSDEAGGLPYMLDATILK